MSVDFDVRPLMFNLERIACAIEKVQLRVDIPEMSPQVHVPAPIVNIEARPGAMTYSGPPPAALPPVAPPVVIVNLPRWPLVLLSMAMILQAAVSLGLVHH